MGVKPCRPGKPPRLLSLLAWRQYTFALNPLVQNRPLQQLEKATLRAGFNQQGGCSMVSDTLSLQLKILCSDRNDKVNGFNWIANTFNLFLASLPWAFLSWLLKFPIFALLTKPSVYILLKDLAKAFQYRTILYSNHQWCCICIVTFCNPYHSFEQVLPRFVIIF